MRLVEDPGTHVTIDDYAAVASLAASVEALRADAADLVPRIGGRTVWMINSTAVGGGVAELLPTQVALLRQLGVDVRWGVIETEAMEFFAFTKRLHNLIHGEGERHPTADERALYEAVNRENADALRAMLSDDDVIVVHDPQPLAIGSMIKEATKARTIWRCHIGLDEDLPATRAAWEFLRPFAETYDGVVFSLDEYVPDFLRDRTTVIHPSIDPLNHKNRDLSLHKLVGILCDAGLCEPHWPLLDPPFANSAQRLQGDGTFAPATVPDDIGLLARPIITQVSRWDRLKGFAPLLEAFRLLKSAHPGRTVRDERHRRRLDNVRLVLAGPDPSAIQDDPEALAVFEELKQQLLSLDPALQADIALVTLPMDSRKQNALMVNALQRSSDIVVQNSLREGFGLTVAEAMWKRAAVLGSGRASGIRRQIRDGRDGRLAPDPEDPAAIAELLHDMLSNSDRLDEWGRNGQRCVHDEFLVLGELRHWLRVLAGAD